jgi:hypothetical protein
MLHANQALIKRTQTYEVSKDESSEVLKALESWLLLQLIMNRMATNSNCKASASVSNNVGSKFKLLKKNG